MSNFCLKILVFQIFGLPPSMCWLTGYKCPSNMKQPQRPDVGRVHCHLLWHFIMLFTRHSIPQFKAEKTGTNPPRFTSLNISLTFAKVGWSAPEPWFAGTGVELPVEGGATSSRVATSLSYLPGQQLPHNADTTPSHGRH